MADWFSGDVVANGVRLHYHRTGGDKPPILLSHGVTDNGLCWTRTARALEGNYDVVMLDARGHGLSDAPESGYAIANLAADLAGAVRALGLERPALIGHSLGAATVALAAADYPDLVSCAVLEDPPWSTVFSGDAGREEFLRLRHERMVQQQSKTVAELIATGRMEHPSWPDSEFEPWAKAKLQLRPSALQAISGLHAPWPEVMARVTCPVLLVTSDPGLGGLVSAETAAEMARKCSQIRVAHIPGAGHNIRREQFEAYMAAVGAFLAEWHLSPA